MDVVRLNMDYYDIEQMEQILESVKAASEELTTSCPIFIDLKGMLITTLSTNLPIQVEQGETVYISDDAEMAGQYKDLFSIDCPRFSAKLRVGDKITLDYGTVELTVRGFKTKEEYLK